MTDSNELSTYKLTGTRMSPKRIEVDTGDAEFVVGKDVNPVEYFLGSIIGCLNSTGTMVARDMDIDIEEMTVELEGGVDYSTYRGEESDARPGLQDLDVTVSVVSDADQATLDEWMAAIEERCPITDNVVNETPIDVAVESA
ncbi:OsmC family protein [Natronoarchaeum sp. GCM10025703]|uniref:OsmC family protein n=1 Tax=unclassified Natronoarchaeum TaxID=2620183 RepID=UPI00361034F8